MRSLLVASALLLCLPSTSLAGFRVSSTKTDSSRQDRWGANSAIDGDMKTCWQVDAESEQKGEWIDRIKIVRWTGTRNESPEASGRQWPG